MADNSNLTIYNSVRAVPKEAQKPIAAGRLKGMTDINPMWRIKTLTEQFGPVGIGWYYDIKERWLDAPANVNEVTANIKIDLFVKDNGEWSKPIQGIGGSKLVASESKGLYVSDECWKMALTDAISVACKALGFGADIYWDKDRTKYDEAPKQDTKPKQQKQTAPAPTGNQKPSSSDSAKVKMLKDELARTGVGEKSLLQHYEAKSLNDIAEDAAKFKNAIDKFKAMPDKATR